MKFHNILRDDLYKQTFNPDIDPNEEPYRPPARSNNQHTTTSHPTHNRVEYPNHLHTENIIGNTGARTNIQDPSAPPTASYPGVPIRK